MNMPLISRWTKDKGKEEKEGKIRWEERETERKWQGNKTDYQNINICQIAQGKSLS